MGFTDIQVRERSPLGIEDLGRYPLFAPEFLDFMRRVMPKERHADLVFAVVVTARKPETLEVGGSRETESFS